MRIDGKKIQNEIGVQLRSDFLGLKKVCTLAIIVVGDNPIVDSFIRIKKHFAREVGVCVIEKKFPDNVQFLELKKTLDMLRDNPEINGIIIQLPLPNTLDTQMILNYIPESKDVDVLSFTLVEKFKKNLSPILPPVVAAIKEILQVSSVDIKNKNIIVLGNGRLVGEPASVWLRQNGAKVQTIDNSTSITAVVTDIADIIICGAGSAGIIKPEMVKSGVILIDAGTSELNGVMVGDLDPRCEAKASLFTPVPGGVGPITVAMIFRNLYILNNK